MVAQAARGCAVSRPKPGGSRKNESRPSADARRSRSAPPRSPPPPLAQAGFPNRPIRLVVPWLPGGSSDTELRVLAELASRKLGQPVLVENKAGATGTLGALMMAQERTATAT